MAGGEFVDGVVAHLAQLVEQGPHLGRERVVRGRGELLDEVELPEVVRADVEVGRRPLSQPLAELAQLHQAGDRVLHEVALGLGAECHEQRVVGREELEIR